MSKVCNFLQQFDGTQLTRQDFYNFTLTAAAADSGASVSTLNRITYAYIAPVIITVGVIGDVLTVATLTHPLLRRCSIIYTYLTLLAMTDLLTHFSVIPMILWLLDWRLCSPMSAFYYAHVGFPLVNALMGASVWLVVFLTFSQYIAVCQPFYQGYLRKRRMCFLLFILSYAFSFCVYAPWSTKKSVYTVPRGLLKCSYVVCDRQKLENWFWLYEWAREFLTRLLPFFLIAYFNVMILVTYRSTKLDRMRRLTQSRHKRGSTERSEQEEKRLFGLLFGIIIIFFLCTIPAAPLTIFVADRRSQNLTFQIFRAVTNLLEFTKFALNFYFYCLINPDIRKICLRIIQCRKLGRPARVKGQPVNPISIYTRSLADSSTKSTIRVANGGAGLGTTVSNTQLQSRRDSIRSRSSNRQLRRANTSDSPRRGSMIAARTTAVSAITPSIGSVDDSFLSLPPQKKRSASAIFLSAEPFVPTLFIQHSETTKHDSNPTESGGRLGEEPTAKTPLLNHNGNDKVNASDMFATSTHYGNDCSGNTVIVLARAESIKRDVTTKSQRCIAVETSNSIIEVSSTSEKASYIEQQLRRQRQPDRPSDLHDLDDFKIRSFRTPEILNANTAALSEIAQIAESSTSVQDTEDIWLPEPINSDRVHLLSKIVAKAQKSFVSGSPVLFSGQVANSPTSATSSKSKFVNRDRELPTLTKVAACAQSRTYSLGYQLNVGASGQENLKGSLREHRQRASDGEISQSALVHDSESTDNHDKSRNANNNSAELGAPLALITHAKHANVASERHAASSQITKTGDFAMISSDDATSLALIAAKALRAMEARRATNSNHGSPFTSIFQRSAVLRTSTHTDTTSLHSLADDAQQHQYLCISDRPNEVSLSNDDVRALALIAANALKTSEEPSMSATACHHLTAIAAKANAALRTKSSESQRPLSNSASLLSGIKKLKSNNSFTATSASLPTYQYCLSPPLASLIPPMTELKAKSSVYSSTPFSPCSPRNRQKCPSPLAINSSKFVQNLSLSNSTYATSTNLMDMHEERHNSKYRKRPTKVQRSEAVIDNDAENAVNKSDSNKSHVSRQKSMQSQTNVEPYQDIMSNGSGTSNSKGDSHQPTRDDSRRRLENARRNFITSAHNAAIVVDSNVVGSVSVDERFRAAAVVVRRTAQQS